MFASRTVCSRYAASQRVSLSVAASACGPASATAAHGCRATTIHSCRKLHSQSELAASLSHGPSQGATRDSPKAASHDPAVALFQEVVNSPSGLSKGPSAAPTPSEWSMAGEINALHRNTRLDWPAKLAHFEANIWPQVISFKGLLPRHLNVAVTQFLRASRKKLTTLGDTSGTATISDMYGKLGMVGSRVRAGLVLNLCGVLADGSVKGNDARPDAKELINLWKDISQANRGPMDPQGQRFMLPSTAEMRKLMKNKKKLNDSSGMPDNLKPFAAILPQYIPSQVENFLPGALATLAVLSDPAISSPQLQREAAPLLNVMALAMEASKLRIGDTESMFEGDKHYLSAAKMADLRAYVMERWPHIRALLHDDGDSWARVLPKTTPPRNGVSGIKWRLSAAYKARNTGAVVSIWENVTESCQQRPEFAAELRRDGADMLNYAVFIWCAVRRPEKLQETLDLMDRIGLQPTVKTYTSMMHGWKVCKNGGHIEALWQKLVEAGVQLDTHIWTERISALIELGRPQDGIHALVEMMDTWKKSSEKNQETTAIKPTIAVVNATLKRLIELDPNAANEVLAWAGRQGLEPDITTYNITLRASLRAQQSKDVQAILQSMSKQGIDPDSATFTIILEEVLGSLRGTTTAEQVTAIQQLFEDIKAMGLRTNAEMYGKMLFAVSSLANGSDGAIEAIQDHMKNNGLTPTPHMVTILIDRCLTRGRDIDSVLRQYSLTSISQADQTLWERVACAYAVTNRLDDAMRLFRDLARAGRPMTSLPNLTDLLKALLENGRREDGKEVIHEVLQHKKREADTHDKSRYWQHTLWFLANKHGLVKREDAPAELWESLSEDRR